MRQQRIMVLFYVWKFACFIEIHSFKCTFSKKKNVFESFFCFPSVACFSCRFIWELSIIFIILTLHFVYKMKENFNLEITRWVFSIDNRRIYSIVNAITKFYLFGYDVKTTLSMVFKFGFFNSNSIFFRQRYICSQLSMILAKQILHLRFRARAFHKSLIHCIVQKTNGTNENLSLYSFLYG